MQTANLTSMIETIFYIVVVYYVFKILARMFLPVVVRKVAEKAEESFRQQYNQAPHYQQAQRQQPPKNDPPKTSKIVGEYVDFEEIE